MTASIDFCILFSGCFFVLVLHTKRCFEIINLENKNNCRRQSKHEFKHYIDFTLYLSKGGFAETVTLFCSLSMIIVEYELNPFLYKCYK